MKEKIKELWQICFADSKEFIDLYFRMRYKEEINIAICENDTPISAFQMVRYPMSFYGHTWQTAYASGVCTHPDYRSKGIMRKLLGNALKQMFDEGVQLSTLIPAEEWLFNYYRSMGYSAVFNYHAQEVSTAGLVAAEDIRVELATTFDETIYHYFNKWQQERPCAILHTEEDFEVVCADLALVGSGVFVAYRENKIVGLCIAYDKGQQMEVNELMADGDDAKHALLLALQKKYPEKKIILLLPATNEGDTQLGMARIIHAKEVLEHYAQVFPDKEMRIRLIDQQIEHNNRFFHLLDGRCHTLDNAPEGSDYATLDISELCEKLLTPLYPFMNLMLN